MIRMEKANKQKLGVLAELPMYNIPLSADHKDSSAEKSHLGFVKKVIMMEKTLILKHISGMLYLLISYSKFTRPFALNNEYNYDIIMPIHRLNNMTLLCTWLIH